MSILPVKYFVPESTMPTLKDENTTKKIAVDLLMNNLDEIALKIRKLLYEKDVETISAEKYSKWNFNRENHKREMEVLYDPKRFWYDKTTIKQEAHELFKKMKSESETIESQWKMKLIAIEKKYKLKKIRNKWIV